MGSGLETTGPVNRCGANSSSGSSATVLADRPRTTTEPEPPAPVNAPVQCEGTVDDIVEFLGSAEGRRAYRFWAGGSLSNARTLRDYGPAVLEAFEATHLMSA